MTLPSRSPIQKGNPLFRYRCLTLLLALLAPLSFSSGYAQAPGALLELIPTGAYRPADIEALAAPLFAPHEVPPLAASVNTYRLRYATTDLDGSPAEIVAQLFVPVLTEETARPVYAFGAGTTGLAEPCAPSKEYEYSHPLGHYRAYLLAYASRGFIGVLPDYLGFNDPERTQAYFNARAEGRVMLDAVRATYAFFEAFGANADVNPSSVRPSGAVFTAGYSQGGHAAFAAADLRPSYAPDVPLTGMIGYGATTNVERLLREGPYYAPYIVQSYAADFEFDPAQVLAERWLPTLEAVANEKCVDQVQQFYPFDASVYAPTFADALYGDRLAEVFPEVKRVLDENRTGLSGHALPALVIQGDDDVIVRNPTQELFVEELCAAASPVLYLTFPGVRHRYTRQAGFEATVAWMEALAAGERAPDTCGEF